MASNLDNNELKWEGKATAELHKNTAEQVWPLLGDFYSFNKWLPTIDTCRQVEGNDGQQLRYCASTPEGGEGVVKWCHEKLVDIDPIGKWLSYEILTNNMGFKDYKSTIKVMPIKGEDDMIKLCGCMIEWSFLADPVEGLSYEDFVKYFEFSLQGIAKNLEKALETN
ncbi:hypothetical protein CASFOL_000074 [Castilleja foliolosa]|uniref:Lachrymatory factor synthase n=1 Tax=Castilleja foliolosa TaxID=1961234 RepID=A0ABD3EMN0_9LAMI